MASVNVRSRVTPDAWLHILVLFFLYTYRRSILTSSIAETAIYIYQVFGMCSIVELLNIKITYLFFMTIQYRKMHSKREKNTNIKPINYAA